MSAIAGPKRSLGRVEFTSLLAMAMALAALGIDLMLPAFGAIRADFGLAADSTMVAGLVTSYFVGLAVGQLLYGPLADRFGRRPVLFVGYGIYGLGALVATVAPSIPLLLAARVLWGVGAAGPRVVTLAIIRDSFDGEAMSRAMSFVMAVFILVPVVAPTLGALVISVAHWRWVFGVCALAVLVMLPWSRRLPETLAHEHRLPLRFGRIATAARFVVSDRRTVGYGLAMTFLYGGFTAYIGSSEIIMGETFDRAAQFPVIFGGLAGIMGAAMLVNAWIVRWAGTTRLAHVVLIAYVLAAAALTAIGVVTGGRPPLPVFLLTMAVMLSAHALLIPNFNTIAMAPMAAVAGTAASVIGSVQIAVGALLGAVLDRAFDGTMLPIAVGFLAYGLVAVALVIWAEGGRMFARPGLPAPPRVTTQPVG